MKTDFIVVRLLFLIVLAYGTLSCSKAEPELFLLGSLAPIELDANSTTITSLNGTLHVSGSCDPRIHSLYIHLEGSSASANVQSLDLKTEGKKKVFSFDIQTSEFAFQNGTIATKKLLVSGQSAERSTKEIAFIVEYAANPIGTRDPRKTLLGGGGELISAPSFKIIGKIESLSAPEVLTNSKYKMIYNPGPKD